MIRRKIGSGAVDPAGVERAWPLSLIRAAREAMGLGVAVTQVTQSAGEIGDLRQDGADGLVIPLIRAGEAVGAVILGAGVFGAAVEWQLCGRIAAGDAERMATRTDAMLVQAWVDLTLALMEQDLSADEDLSLVAGLRAAGGMGDLSGLVGEYRQIEAQVTIGGGLRSGGFTLIAPRRLSVSAKADRDFQFNAALRQHVLTTEAVMKAVLTRMTLPLASVLALREGGCMPLSGASVQEMTLEGPDGTVLAKVRLGQQKGMRAIRLIPEGAENRETNVIALREAG